MTEEQAANPTEQQKNAGPIPITFGSFIHSLAMSALVHLGEVPDPTQGEVRPSLPLARQTIDLLGVLAEKTKGNLEDDEDQLLTSLLFDLRLKFVEASRKG